MKTLQFVLCLFIAAALAACAVTAERFPGTVVAPPVDLAGQWQLVLGGQTSVFVLTPAEPNHYRVTSPTAADSAPAMDASVQAYEGVPYLVVADTSQATGVSVFRVLGATPTSVRIAALDPARTEAVLKERGLPIARKKMWLYEEIALSAPALRTVLSLPAADVFAMDEGMTLQRVQ